MKVGLGLYRHMLNPEYYAFARQAGCTHVVVHLVDYFHQGPTNPRNNQPTGAKYDPWGVPGNPEICGQSLSYALCAKKLRPWV
jgi:mannonate dehydratase